MRVACLAAGAAGMYCGSCMRDNRLAARLIEDGRDVVLIPLYTPLRTDESDVSTTPVLMGGLSVYLHHRAPWLRRLPRLLQKGLDSPLLLKLVSRMATRTSPAMLGALTVDVLSGSRGAISSDIDRLIEGLRFLAPDVVNLPNLMFAGVAAPIRDSLGVPVLCTLSGEDVFLDDLSEPYRERSFDLIREADATIDGYVAMTRYYADHAAVHFGLSREKIEFSPLGIRVEDFSDIEPSQNSVPTIGYLARICEAKGLMNLASAVIELHRRGIECNLSAAGYMGKADRAYLARVERTLESAGLKHRFAYAGEVDREGKARFYGSVDVFSVPTSYREAKGLFVLEAMSAARPVVQPSHGSFPELIEATGGGLLYTPGSTEQLADHLASLLANKVLRDEMGMKGRAAVCELFNDRIMADSMWRIYASYARASD